MLKLGWTTKLNRPAPEIVALHATKAIAFVLVLLVLFTFPIAGAGGTNKAQSRTSATGSMIVVWGDPYTVMSVAVGEGKQSVRLQGQVVQRSDLPGFYVYTTMRLSGTSHVEWTSGRDAYVLDVIFEFTADQTPMMPATTLPGADSFVITEMLFEATLSINGQEMSDSGMGQVLALAPGCFGFDGAARVTVILLYAPLLDIQFGLRWSSTAQTISGIEHPAAEQFRQQVTLSGRS